MAHTKVACLALVVATGCAHFRVTPAALSPSTLEETRHVHALAWGLLEPRIEPPNCHGNGLSQVTVKITLIDAAAAAFTLGFWTPVTVKWTCATRPGGVVR